MGRSHPLRCRHHHSPHHEERLSRHTAPFALTQVMPFGLALRPTWRPAGRVFARVCAAAAVGRHRRACRRQAKKYQEPCHQGVP